MKEPEGTLNTHVIKRVFVILLILWILLEVGTQPAWRSAEATTMADNAQNALSVVESARNGVAIVAKADDAQNRRSVVELEPAWRGATKLGKDQRKSESESEINQRKSEFEPQFNATLGKDQRKSESESELNQRKSEFEPQFNAKLGNDQTSEPELQAADVKAEDAQTERSVVELELKVAEAVVTLAPTSVN